MTIASQETRYAWRNYLDYKHVYNQMPESLPERAKEIRRFFQDLIADGELVLFNLENVDWEYIAKEAHLRAA